MRFVDARASIPHSQERHSDFWHKEAYLGIDPVDTMDAMDAMATSIASITSKNGYIQTSIYRIFLGFFAYFTSKPLAFACSLRD